MALGCFGLTTAFLAVIALGGLAYAGFDQTASTGLRIVAGVLGVVFLVMVVGLVMVNVRAVRRRPGLAFDADAVWCRTERSLIRLPWDEIAVVRVVAPKLPKRTSAPRTPIVEICPVGESTVRSHPELAERIAAGEPVRPDLPSLRFAFHLSAAVDEAAVDAALDRFAPDRRVR